MSRTARTLTRPVALLAVASASAVALTALTAPAASAAQPKPTVVLVHGAWADGSSWAEVTERLQRRGYPVQVAANPLRGLASDAASLSAFLTEHTEGPVVLVGHSYGGAVISAAAGSDPDVKALVFVNAFIPDEGESLLGLLSSTGEPPDAEALFDAVHYPGAPEGDVDLYFKAEVFPSAFANGLSERTAAVLAASQRPITLSALAEHAAPAPAWKGLPSWAVVGTEDHVIPPPLQQSMAERAGAAITTVDAGHLALLSEPSTVAGVIRDAARAVD